MHYFCMAFICLLRPIVGIKMRANYTERANSPSWSSRRPCRGHHGRPCPTCRRGRPCPTCRRRVPPRSRRPRARDPVRPAINTVGLVGPTLSRSSTGQSAGGTPLSTAPSGPIGQFVSPKGSSGSTNHRPSCQYRWPRRLSHPSQPPSPAEVMYPWHSTVT